MIQLATKPSAGTALITGASSGIGYEFALLFAREGYDLVLVARNRAALTALAAHIRDEFGRRVDVFVKDLSVQTAAAELFQEVQRKDLSIDVLVNDAGFAMQGEFAENDPGQLTDLLQVNILTLTQLTRLFLPQMRRRGHSKILNMASIGAFMPGPMLAAYFASKAYVLSLSEALSNELQGTGITVTAVCPGPTRTRFAQRARLIDTRAFSGHLLEAADVAREGFNALMKGKRVVVTGLKYRLQLFPTPLVPRRVLAYFARQYHESHPGAAQHPATSHVWSGSPDTAPPTRVAQP